MPITAGVIGVGAPILGGIVGNLFGNSEEEKAAQALADAKRQIEGVNAPNVEEQRIALQKLASQGQLTPEMEQALNLGPSKMEGISTDPRLRAAQMAALSSLQEVGATGLNATDRAALQAIRNQNLQQTHANQESVLQNMQQRGVAGSGAELAAKLAAGQAGASEAQNQGLNVAAQAQARALQGMAQAGQLGGQLESQQFGEQSDIARAADEIARFNTANQQNVQQRNVGSRNTAQAANLAEKQRIADQNAALANQQEVYNKQLYQQQYQNQMQRAQALANQDQVQYGANKANAAQTRKMWGDIGSGVGKGASAFAGAGGFGGGASGVSGAATSAGPNLGVNTSIPTASFPNYSHGGEVEDMGNNPHAINAWDEALKSLAHQKLAQHMEHKAFGGMADAGGGMNYADGGQVAPSVPVSKEAWELFQKGFNAGLNSPKSAPSPTPENHAFGGMTDESGMWAGGVIPSMPNYAMGGTVNSGPSIYLGEYAEGGQVHDFRHGGKVPGQAPFPGDNLKNDIVPAMVSPGEIVVPRSIADKDHHVIASFVKAVKHNSDQKHLNTHRMPEERMPEGKQLNLKLPGVK